MSSHTHTQGKRFFVKSSMSHTHKIFFPKIFHCQFHTQGNFSEKFNVQQTHTEDFSEFFQCLHTHRGIFSKIQCSTDTHRGFFEIFNVFTYTQGKSFFVKSSMSHRHTQEFFSKIFNVNFTHRGFFWKFQCPHIQRKSFFAKEVMFTDTQNLFFSYFSDVLTHRENACRNYPISPHPEILVVKIQSLHTPNMCEIFDDSTSGKCLSELFNLSTPGNSRCKYSISPHPENVWNIWCLHIREMLVGIIQSLHTRKFSL